MKEMPADLRTGEIQALGVPAKRELGNFLSTRRARLTPEQVGLSGGGRRHVAGLRREEVAVLANVSETWYSRLEQGREVNPSAAVLDAIARALRLTAQERGYLFTLAGVALPGTSPLSDVPPALQTTLDAMPLAPAVAIGPRWDVVAQNRAYVAVFGDIFASSAAQGNIVRDVFLTAERRLFFEDWEDVARAVLQAFRVNWARHTGDASFNALVEDVRRNSAEFDAWWEQHDVERRVVGMKRMRHPVAGNLELDHLALTIPQTELMIIAYTAAPGSRSERQISALMR